MSVGAAAASRIVEPLVRVKWLAERLSPLINNLPNQLNSVKVAEAVSQQPDKLGSYQPPTYTRAHIPTATWFNARQISNPKAPLELTVPTADQFAEYVSKRGISNSDHVVLYDHSSDLAFDYPTARIWWLFHLFGHRNVSVLDGGIRKWIEAGHSVTDKVQDVKETDFKAKLNEDLISTYDEIIANPQTHKYQIIDVRSPRAFIELTYPGAKNVFYQSCYNEDGSFKSKDQLEDMFASLNLASNQPITTSCNRGMSACILSLAHAITHESNQPCSVYDGSWVEYKGGVDREGQRCKKQAGGG